MPNNALPDKPERWCKTMDEHFRLLAEDHAYALTHEALEALTNAYQQGLKRSARVGVTEIPAIVHVVYRLPDENLSDALIKNQIELLNKDFRKRNLDVDNVPEVWRHLVADVRMEFRLVQITRKKTDRALFNDPRDVKFPATGGTNAWSARHYLNIWTCNLRGGEAGAGTLPGRPPEEDGVVIAFRSFGNENNKHTGLRTVTHEIGHWLNLHHIWGDNDNSCIDSDLVDDTPNQLGPNYDIPDFPHVSCGNGPDGDMFMNYMDYVDDAAMVMFTAGQVTRMDAALDFRRMSIDHDDLLFYDDNNGTGDFASVSNGVVSSIGTPNTGWRKSWSIVPGRFGGDTGCTDLLFLDSNTGEGFFHSVRNGAVSQFAQTPASWRKTWRQIIPGNFGGGTGGTDLLFYDANNGTGDFASVSNGVVSSIGAPNTGWRKSWSIVPGRFGGDTGCTDLLFLDSNTGEGFFHSVRNGAVSQFAQTPASWQRSWKQIVPGMY